MSARFLFWVVMSVLVLSCEASAAEASAETFAPTAYGVDRYQHIWKRSPFIVETVAAVQSPGLASKYGLVGIASLNKSPVVFLWDKNENDPFKSRFMVSQAKADAVHNIELVSVAMDKDPRKSTATIKQGTEQALLQFDPSGIPPSGPAAGVSAVPTPAMPATYVPPPPTGLVAPNASAVPAPPPSGSTPLGRGLLSPGSGVVTPAPVNPSVQSQPPPVRRIIRPKPIDVN